MDLNDRGRRHCSHDRGRDTLPEHPQITVANGAGHGFTFAALIGRVLADLALDHEPAHPIDAFSITRPALTDPSFPRSFHA